MATSETIKYTFISSDGKSLLLSYNPDGNTIVDIKIQLNGSFYSWCTVEDFQDFVSNVLSCNNILNSPSGVVGTSNLHITNGPVSLIEGATYTFTATGGSNSGYTFSVVEGTGSITSEGAFTAPNTVETDVIKVVDSDSNVAYAIALISSSGIEYIPSSSGTIGSDHITD